MRRLFILLFFVAALLLCGCQAAKSGQAAPTREAPATQPLPTDQTTPTQPNDVSPDGQLKGRAESQAEAEEIAELYGITLVDYDGFGLALYYTEKDPEEVIRLGEENGWPELSLNLTASLY